MVVVHAKTRERVMLRSTGSESDADAGKALAAIATKPKRKSSNSAGHDCTICRKSNMTLSGLKIHLLTHSGEKPFACTECEKRFTCSSNLKKHQRIHNRDYIYECAVCGKTCSDPSNMKKHMTVHSDEKAYTCPSCGKSYSYAQSLRQHMDDVHVGNGERRRKIKKKGHFPCPECGKVFGYYWRCSLHQARIHAVEKPYKCPECGKAFARETILNKHVQTHEKPFPCTVCERRFSFRDQLRKHMRIHTGEKPYTCEQCFRSFTQRGSLTEHLRTHTGEKPFSCTNCGQKFSSSSSLKRHERRVNACLSQNLAEEIPLPDTNHRRVIYITTQPVTMMGLASSTISQPLVVDPRDVTGYSTRFSPVDHGYGNGTIAFHPSALTDTGRITMVDRSTCFAVPNEDVKPKLRPNGTIAMATQDYRPNYGTITMVSNNVDRSGSVGNLSFAMANQLYEPSILQSIAMDLEDVKNRLPLYRNDSPLSTKEAKSFQYYNPAHPSVTLTTNGVKPLAAMEDVYNASVDYQARPPHNQHSDVDGTNYYARSPGRPSILTHSPGTENVEPFIQTSVVTMAGKNVRPYEYPIITMVTEDGKALSEINGINSMVPSHLLSKTGTTASTLVTA